VKCSGDICTLGWLVPLELLAEKSFLLFHFMARQVLAAGDLCAICQEKMHAPILLQCKHIFCEDCASEWYVVHIGSYGS
jgi:hypothetical protein